MASNVPESKTLIRSVIDALRGTPSMLPRDEDTSRNLPDLSPETSQNEEDLDKQLDEIGNEATDNEELRHDGRAELGRQEEKFFPESNLQRIPDFVFRTAIRPTFLLTSITLHLRGRASRIGGFPLRQFLFLTSPGEISL